jgi:phospholipase C
MSDNGSDSKISNVFVLMLENHSFDNIFAMSCIPGIQAATVEDSNFYYGQEYFVKDGAPWSMTTDPGHEFADVAEQLRGVGYREPLINMSGFASSYATSVSEATGRPAADHIGDIMACFDTSNQLPVIYQLACEFAICDQWFSSIPGPTWPNRFFVHGASSAGWADSPVTKDEIPWYIKHGFTYEHGSIYDALQNQGHKWRLYNDNHNAYSDDRSGPEFGGWISQVASLKGISQLDVHSMDRFASDLKKMNGDVPAYTYPYTFIEPNFGRSFFSPQPRQKGVPHLELEGPTYKGGSSQHPEDDPSGGEGLIKAVYEAIRNSPVWDTSLLVIVYDEHGGFYDSVSPGRAVPPGDVPPPGQETRNRYGFDFSQYGVRVPAVIVSPLIPRGTVDHTTYDHTSILATVERLLGMRPLTKRDRCANDLHGLLTNSTPRKDCPTKLACPVRVTPDRGRPGEDLLSGLKHILDDAVEKVEGAVDRVKGDITGSGDEPLPESGNVIGFLHILHKTELECSGRLNGNDAAEQARILENFKNIRSKRQAQAYVKRMHDMIESVKQNSG